MNSKRRRGLSLLEVILALAILGMSLAIIGEMVRLGLRSSVATRDLTTAQLLCESKLAEIVAGVEPLAATSGAPLDPEGLWTYTVQMESAQEEGLVTIQVTVQQATTNRPVSFSLVRWMIDPGVEIIEEEPADE